MIVCVSATRSTDRWRDYDDNTYATLASILR